MRPAVLVVFVDALGPAQAELLIDAGLTLPHVTTARGVLGYSSGALPTILTGVSPEKHGRMCLFARADGQSPLAPLRWLGLLPRVVHERARLRRYLGRAFAASLGYDGYFALHRVPPALFAQLDVPEKEDLFTAPDIGGAPTFLAAAREAGLEVGASSWRLPESERVAAIEARASADLAFLYLSGLDGILHQDGALSARAAEWARSAVGYVERARRALAGGRAERRDVRTLVVGDHGMATVRTVVDPRPVVARIRAADPRAFAFVDSTMLRVTPTGANQASVRRALSDLPGVLLDADGLRLRGAPTDAGYGDLVALLPEGSLFAPSYVGGFVRGMHGYDRTCPSADAAILSDAPIAGRVTRLEDVAPWVFDALDLARPAVLPAGAS
ncbi:MAG TPA: alkaline phosphatase family protein [Polyangiaceae bacterium]|jgi:hypothetical protein|nr:alkaline phosphatase family protein [Polyangiaceae bacterium]